MHDAATDHCANKRVDVHVLVEDVVRLLHCAAVSSLEAGFGLGVQLGEYVRFVTATVTLDSGVAQSRNSWCVFVILTI